MKTHRPTGVPRAIKHSRIVGLKAKFLQPGVLCVIDKQISGGRATGHGARKKELQTKDGIAGS